MTNQPTLVMSTCLLNTKEKKSLLYQRRECCEWYVDCKREVVQSTNPGHCSCPYFTQSRESHARIIWKTLRTFCIINIYSYTYSHLSGYKENVCTNLQHHPEFQVEVGKLISVLHSKPIQATWEWHATGWTLWFVYCWRGQVGSIYINSNTTQSDSWLPTASPAKEHQQCEVILPKHENNN